MLARYDPIVPEKIWTAAELEKLTPSERDAIFDASIVTDLRQAPPTLVARARARVTSAIAAAEASQQA